MIVLTLRNYQLTTVSLTQTLAKYQRLLIQKIGRSISREKGRSISREEKGEVGRSREEY